MKAKLVSEAIKHLKPRSKKELETIYNKLYQIDEVTEIMNKEHKGTLFCFFVYDEGDVMNDYSTNPQDILKEYIEYVRDFRNDYNRYHGDKTVYIAIYKITPGIFGRFTHDYDMKGTGSVNLLFQISLETDEIYGQ